MVFYLLHYLYKHNNYNKRDLCGKLVPVTTAWLFLRLRTEERPPIWRVAATVLNKQSRTTKKGHEIGK